VLTSAVINVRQRQPEELADIRPSGWALLLLVGLTSAVLAHFVEINVGIAIAATNTYFWLCCPDRGHRLQAARKTRNGTEKVSAEARPAQGSRNNPPSRSEIRRNRARRRLDSTGAEGAFAAALARPSPPAQWLVLAVVAGLILAT